MLPVIAGLRARCANAAAGFLETCRYSGCSSSQLLLDSCSQPTLWPAQQYSTAQDNADPPVNGAKHADRFGAWKAKLENAVPVQPTHQILKVLLQSEAPLTSHQLFVKVREEFGVAAFPTRRYFKMNLQQLQKRHWVKAKAPESYAVSGVKAGKKAGIKAESFVFTSTKRAATVDLNQPGEPLQQAARAAADKWTEKNLGLYKELLQEGKVQPTLDNLALLPAEQRQKLFLKIKPDRKQGR